MVRQEVPRERVAPVLNASQESDHKRTEKHPVGWAAPRSVFRHLNKSKSGGVVRAQGKWNRRSG